MAIVTRKRAEKELNVRREVVTEDDLQQVLDKRQQIQRKFDRNGPLETFISELKTLFSLIQDYASGKYREIPWWSIAAVVAALLYVLNPIDLIPDFIPVVGYVDDAMVVAACLKAVGKNLRKYRDWKERNKSS